MPRYPREAKLEMIRLYREEHRSMNWIVEHYGVSLSYLRHLLEFLPGVLAGADTASAVF